jgi:phosphoribosylaminoimidazole-succinocarboxamide synthase
MDASFMLYDFASAAVAARGLILADTKFEFGFIGGELYLIDEALTPDSSRYWDAAGYEPGRAQESFDKQFVRDYLIASGWDRNPPAPPLPQAVVDGTSARYLEAFERITGKALSA